MTNPTLVATLTQILRQPCVMKINFQLNGLLVNGERFGRVAQAVSQGLIACELLADYPLPKDEIPKGGVIAAHYTTSHHVMLFERPDYAATGATSEEATIVHESTHAMFDLFAPGKNFTTLSIDDESCAVLAAALYVRLCDKRLGGFAMEEAEAEALKLANTMIAETNGFETDKRTYVVTPDDAQWLRNAVAKQWGFIRTADKSGITDKSTAVYVYGGVVKCLSCSSKTTALPPSHPITMPPQR
jgi:hypothetical protein